MKRVFRVDPCGAEMLSRPQRQTSTCESSNWQPHRVDFPFGTTHRGPIASSETARPAIFGTSIVGRGLASHLKSKKISEDVVFKVVVYDPVPAVVAESTRYSAEMK
jgi:hypothetical protein